MVESILILLLLHTEDRTKRERARTKAGAAIKETETLFTFFSRFSLLVVRVTTYLLLKSFLSTAFCL